MGRGYQWVVPAGRPGSLRRVLRWGKFSRRALCSPHINTNQGLFEEHSTGPPLQESRYKREPHPAPPSRQVLIVAMATDDGLDARLSSRGLPKHTQIKEVGRGAASAPPSLGWVAEATPPTHTHTTATPTPTPQPPGAGRRAQRGFPLAASPAGVWGMDGDTVAEAPTRATALKRGRGVGQIGNRWGHRARPRHPIRSRGRDGRRRGAPRGRPIQAGAAARAGLKSPPERQGGLGPPASPRSPGKLSGSGGDPEGDPGVPQGAALPPCSQGSRKRL